MADFPRWVDRSDVDSSAMLSAFITYHTEVSAMLEQKNGLSYQPVWEGHLWSIIHRPAPALEGVSTPLLPLRIPQLPCRDPACQRCGVRGGYQFRWFSPYWAHYYNSMRKPGSWEAPDPGERAIGIGRRGEHWRRQHERFWRPTRD